MNFSNVESTLVESFCRRLPKVELHAHLNGSLSEETLHTLYSQNSDLKADESKEWISAYCKGDKRSLEECFKIFAVAHAVTVTPDAVRKGTKDVISDFAADGVLYLELRTTPRAVAGVMSKKQYIQAVIDAIKEVPIFMGPENFIIVKLLISINRRESLAEAEENIREAIAAHTAHPDIVVGVDLSGNPRLGNIREDFLPLFVKARSAGLKVALHFAEIQNEDEIEAMLGFKPERLGHGTCIHPSYGGSKKLWDLFLQSRIPLEVCLTSNVKCETVKNYESHHLQYLLPHNYPFAISTDDKAVFSTTLSKEFEVVAKTFNLSLMDLFKCVETAISISFASSEEKKQLLEKLQDFKLKEGF